MNPAERQRGVAVAWPDEGVGQINLPSEDMDVAEGTKGERALQYKGWELG